jgi:hypothetical protein
MPIMKALGCMAHGLNTLPKGMGNAWEFGRTPMTPKCIPTLGSKLHEPLVQRFGGQNLSKSNAF